MILKPYIIPYISMFFEWFAWKFAIPLGPIIWVFRNAYNYLKPFFKYILPFIEWLINIMTSFLMRIGLIIRKTYNYFKLFEFKQYKLAMTPFWSTIREVRHKSNDDKKTASKITMAKNALQDNASYVETDVKFEKNKNLNETELKIKEYLNNKNLDQDVLSKAVPVDPSKKSIAPFVEKFRKLTVESLGHMLNKLDVVQKVDYDTLNITEKKHMMKLLISWRKI